MHNTSLGQKHTHADTFQAARRAEVAQVDDELTVFDAKVAAPTRVPGQVVYMDDDGAPVQTKKELVMVLPTKLAVAASGTTTTTMTSMSTETVLVSLPINGGAEASPVVVAGGQQQSPEDSQSSGSATGGDPAGEADVDGRSDLFGISYAPYKADHSCKSAQDIMDDFQRIKGEYSLVRIYGTDCDQVPNVYSAAKKIGVKLMMGIWDINDVPNEASKIADSLKGDWDMVHSVGVGNELVNNGEASAQDVVGAVSQARKALRNAGYEGPVVTVDTFLAAQSHPELCEESDYCAINAHAFFDSTMAAKDAGKWLQNTVGQVKSSLSKPMKVVVTETGWPTKGTSNGMAVPGLENQKAALQSIRKAFADHPADVVLFSAYDDMWKEKNMRTFEADQHWGINGAIANSDLALI